MTTNIAPNTTISTVSTTSTPATTGSTTGTTANAQQQIAGNFNQFLQLLTTQLQNQNPLDPLDTNQFTQQLVEFAGVQQQINTNSTLSSLLTLQQTAQATQALNFVGTTVAVSGSTAQMSNAQANWTYTPASSAKATFTITNSSGQTVFSQSGVVAAGAQQFTWNGVDSSGQQWPDGNYTLSITATDPTTGKSVAVPTQINGVVSQVDLTQNPPMLTVAGQNFTVNQILRVLNPATTSSSLGSSLSNAASSVANTVGSVL